MTINKKCAACPYRKFTMSVRRKITKRTVGGMKNVLDYIMNRCCGHKKRATIKDFAERRIIIYEKILEKLKEMKEK